MLVKDGTIRGIEKIIVQGLIFGYRCVFFKLQERETRNKIADLNRGRALALQKKMAKM